ncbi:hypothetical protein F2P79_011263 [Pimephales promelas]|nr:hypothetical protein F2P79_011263 [Pimephales promelas]
MVLPYATPKFHPQGKPTGFQFLGRDSLCEGVTQKDFSASLLTVDFTTTRDFSFFFKREKK